MLDAMIDIDTPDAELTFHAHSVADTLARVDGLGERIKRELDQLRKIAAFPKNELLSPTPSGRSAKSDSYCVIRNRNSLNGAR